MDILFVLDDFGVDSFEFGFQSRVACSLRGAVGATAGFAHIVVVVLEFGYALHTPVEERVSKHVLNTRLLADRMCTDRTNLARLTYQLPLPPPCFFTPAGSTPMPPDLAK